MQKSLKSQLEQKAKDIQNEISITVHYIFIFNNGFQNKSLHTLEIRKSLCVGTIFLDKLDICSRKTLKLHNRTMMFNIF